MPPKGQSTSGETSAILTEIQKLSKKFDSLEAKFHILDSRLRALERARAADAKKIEVLGKDDEKLTKTVECLSDRLDVLEQEKLNSKLIVWVNDDFKSTVTAKLHAEAAQSQEDIRESSTSTEHPTQTPTTAEYRKKSISTILILEKLKLSTDTVEAKQVSKFGDTGFLWHLDSHDIKQKLIKAARTAKPEGIFVNKFLIKKKLELLKELRKMKNDDEKFSSVWTRNGWIFVKDDENSDPREIKKLE